MSHPPKLTARSLLLDLLRASDPEAWPVKVLVEVAALFDISENALRVNITRLVSRGLLMQDSRGYYRLAPSTDAMHKWVNAWSQGEKRVVDWRGAWVTLAIEQGVNARALVPLTRTLHRLGFRALQDRYWVRPDNLATSPRQLYNQIVQLGGSERFVLAVATEVIIPADHPPLRSLWQAAELEQQYRSYLKRIKKSLNTLRSADVEQVLRDTFLLGGEVIYVLALDPLLPAKFVNTELRAELCEVMCEYDNTFRSCWQEHFGIDQLNRVAVD